MEGEGIVGREGPPERGRRIPLDGCELVREGTRGGGEGEGDGLGSGAVDARAKRTCLIDSGDEVVVGTTGGGVGAGAGELNASAVAARGGNVPEGRGARVGLISRRGAGEVSRRVGFGGGGASVGVGVESRMTGTGAGPTPTNDRSSYLRRMNFSSCDPRSDSSIAVGGLQRATAQWRRRGEAGRGGGRARRTGDAARPGSGARSCACCRAAA